MISGTVSFLVVQEIIKFKTVHVFARLSLTSSSLVRFRLNVIMTILVPYAMFTSLLLRIWLTCQCIV